MTGTKCPPLFPDVNYAYPSHVVLPEEDGRLRHFASPGMTLRDHFAAAALKGLLTPWVGRDGEPITLDNETAAKRAYAVADAMLAAREGK